MRWKGKGPQLFWRAVTDNISKSPLSATGKDEDARTHLAFYRFVIDNLPVAVPTVDSKLKISSFNPWAEEVTGCSAKEALGRYCGEILQGGLRNDNRGAKRHVKCEGIFRGQCLQ